MLKAPLTAKDFLQLNGVYCQYSWFEKGKENKRERGKENLRMYRVGKDDISHRFFVIEQENIECSSGNINQKSNRDQTFNINSLQPLSQEPSFKGLI